MEGAARLAHSGSFIYYGSSNYRGHSVESYNIVGIDDIDVFVRNMAVSSCRQFRS